MSADKHTTKRKRNKETTIPFDETDHENNNEEPQKKQRKSVRQQKVIVISAFIINKVLNLKLLIKMFSCFADKGRPRI